MRFRFIRVLFAAVAVATGGTGATTGAQAQPASASDAYVSYWDGIGNQAFTAAALAPPEGAVIFANVGIAEYDSVLAIEGGYQPFAVDLDAPDGASPEAAVVAAAHAILAHYLPDQGATILDPAYVQSLGTIPDGQAKDDGVATGEEVAAILIEQRADDGFRAPVTYTPPDPPIPGVWIPTAPSPPIGTYLPYMRPFGLDSPDQFRPGGPPPLSSRRWAEDYNEVKEIGSRTSTTRTPEQTLAARFWAEPPLQQARLPQVRPRPWAGHRRRVTVHGDDDGRPGRRTDRLLRRQIPLRVLAADHGDPGRRHRRQRRDQSPIRTGCRCCQLRRTTRSTRVRTRA